MSAAALAAIASMLLYDAATHVRRARCPWVGIRSGPGLAIKANVKVRVWVRVEVRVRVGVRLGSGLGLGLELSLAVLGSG